jgi:hypothetical protein
MKRVLKLTKLSSLSKIKKKNLGWVHRFLDLTGLAIRFAAVDSLACLL